MNTGQPQSFGRDDISDPDGGSFLRLGAAHERRLVFRTHSQLRFRLRLTYSDHLRVGHEMSTGGDFWSRRDRRKGDAAKDVDRLDEIVN